MPAFLSAAKLRRQLLGSFKWLIAYTIWNRTAHRQARGWQKPFRWLYSGMLMLTCLWLALEINFLWLFGAMPSMLEIKAAELPIASEIYSADGQLLGKFYTENRSPVGFHEIDSTLWRTLVAVEDVRFFQHFGIDPKALGAAAADAARGNARGASTISQQLAKNLFKTRSDDKGALGYVPYLNLVLAKAKEWVTAVKLELFFSKEEILTLYLNTVDFGRNSFGIKSAARIYFNSSPNKLKPEECAVLVGMLKAPTYYNPVSNPKNSVNRRNLVLSIMAEQGIISADEAQKLQAKPLVLRYKEEEVTDGLAPYFRAELAKWLRAYLKQHYVNRYSIYTSGLRIETTLDSRMQVQAEAAVGKSMQQLHARFKQHWQGGLPWTFKNGQLDTAWFAQQVRATERYQQLSTSGLPHDSIFAVFNQPIPMEIFSWKGTQKVLMSPLDSLKHRLQILHGGLLAIDPYSGQIKAWVGGINYGHFKYDHVNQMRRQPGSTFKPFVYAAALEAGRGPCDQLTDKPVRIEYQEKGETKVWAPRNADWVYSYEPYTLRRAMARSINTIAAQLTELVGPEAVVKMAQKLGISSPLEALPAIGLGASDVSLLELTGAYAAFMNQGEWIEPHFVSKVYDRKGRLLFTYKPERRQAMTPENAFLMTYMLRGSTEEYGGTSGGLYAFDVFRNGNQLGGKTGTSQNYADGWFVGMTKDLVVGSWVGADQRRVHFRTSQTGEGSKTALPLVGRFLENCYRNQLLEWGKFPLPAVTINKKWQCPPPAIPKSTETDSTVLMPSDSLLLTPATSPSGE